MKPFTDYFSPEEITGQLCKERLRLAQSRREARYVPRLIGSPEPDPTREVYHLLPSYNQWHRFRPRERRPGIVANPAEVALRRASASLRQSTPSAPWIVALNGFIERIRSRVLSERPFAFSPPEIHWQLKEENKYRPLCRFELEDNIINSLLAKYLRKFFDAAFEDSSYAFRVRSALGVMPTHHLAFESLYQLKCSAPRKDLYVAECDIRAFYDSVAHDVALSSLNRVLQHITTIQPERHFHHRARELFSAYLDCYTFPQNVIRDTEPRLKQEEGENAHFPWPRQALEQHHTSPMHAKIGVPQGGAVSCFVANLVFDFADKRIENLNRSMGDLHYLRYCDDSIIVASSRSHCQKAFDLYLEALTELKLPYHEPQMVTMYGREFWDGKSKAPYRWTGKKGKGCVPWVQFVGYQLRYDGLVRIKKKSVEKQLRKLLETTDEVKFGLLNRQRQFPGPTQTPPIRSRKSEVLSSLRRRLTNISVGRVKLGRKTNGPMPMCWASGYKALNGKAFVTTFLKKFDRQRERQFRRLKRAEIVYGPGSRQQNGRRRLRDPIGSAFSYFSQFQNKGGQDLINNPYRPWWTRLFTRPIRLFLRKCRRLAAKVGRLVKGPNR